MDKPANDNHPAALTRPQADGPLGAVSQGVRFSFANILRIMRGAGVPGRVLNDIENLALETSKTNGDAAERAAVLEQVVCGLTSWLPDNSVELSFRDRSEQRFCEAALRLVAAKLDRNRIQLGQASNDLWRTCNDVWAERDAEWTARFNLKREASLNEAMAQAALRIAVLSEVQEAISAAPPTECFVYFITDGEAIKIGKATDPKARLSGLQTSNHKLLSVLALTPGDETLERELHGLFAEHRIRGEWFRDCEKIRTFIDDILAGRYQSPWSVAA